MYNTAHLPPQFLLYCEGTRFTETKHQISMQVAESKGLPKLKYHLLPRTKGFTTTLQCLKGTGSVNKHTQCLSCSIHIGFFFLICFFFSILQYLLCMMWLLTSKTTKLPLSWASSMARNTKLTWVWGECHWYPSFTFESSVIVVMMHYTASCTAFLQSGKWWMYSKPFGDSESVQNVG